MPERDHIFTSRAEGWGLGPRLSSPVRDDRIYVEIHSVFDHWKLINNEIFKLDRPCNLYFDVIDNSTVNAVADFAEDIGLVGVTSGAVCWLSVLPSLIVSHPQALPTIGRPDAERVSQQHQGVITHDFADWIAATGLAKIDDVVIFDPVRFAYARRVSNVLIAFLLNHEIHHIIDGHVHYIQEATNLPFVLESMTGISQKATDFDYFLIRQTLEVAADTGGVIKSLWEMMLIRDHLTKNEAEANTSGFATVEEAIFLWSFAISILFIIWGIELDSLSLDGRTHPPTALRFRLCVESAIDLLKANNVQISGEPINHFANGWYEAVRCLNLIGGRFPVSMNSDIAAAFQRDGLAWKRIDSYHKTWASLRPELLRVAFRQNLMKERTITE